MKNHDFADNAGLVDFNIANGGVEFAGAADLGAMAVIGKFADFAAPIGGNAGAVVFGGPGGIIGKFGNLPLFQFGEDQRINAEFGGNAGEVVFGGVGGIQIVLGQKIVGDVAGTPLINMALQSINDQSTTSLDLSGTELSDHNLPVIYQNLPNNQNISFVNFSNNPMINTHSVVHLCNDHNHSLVSVDFTGCNINVDSFNHQLVQSSIDQSPLVSCRFGDVNLLPEKAQAATAILSNLHSFLGPEGTFDIGNPGHRQALIHFFKSPKAQKALKWLSENIQDHGLVFKGDAFVTSLQTLRDYNLFHLKGVCKTIADKESCLIPHDALPNILSYLSFDDIVFDDMVEMVVVTGDTE